MEAQKGSGPVPADEAAPKPQSFAESSRAAGLAQCRVQISAGEVIALRAIHQEAQRVLSQGLQAVFSRYAEALPGPIKFVEKAEGSDKEYILHHAPSHEEAPKIQLATAAQMPRVKPRKNRR